MTGGKSSSESNTSSSNETTTSTATSSGTVGDVVQGQTITINQDLPDQAVDVFKQLVSLAKQSIDVAAGAGQKALDATNNLASQAKQPDLALVQGYQNQVKYAIIAGAVVVAVIFVFRRK